jgi:hypothetical protein
MQFLHSKVDIRVNNLVLDRLWLKFNQNHFLGDQGMMMGGWLSHRSKWDGEDTRIEP